MAVSLSRRSMAIFRPRFDLIFKPKASTILEAGNGPQLPSLLSGPSGFSNSSNFGFIASVQCYSRGFAAAAGLKSMNYVRSVLQEENNFSGRKKSDFVHILMKRKKTFVAVTDANGNKKTGASAGCLEGGRSRMAWYSAKATAEHVGRSARNIGVKSVVMKVKGYTFFKKKKKVILSWRDGFRGEGMRKSPIVSIQDVTQLPHNGCRLRKSRRI